MSVHAGKGCELDNKVMSKVSGVAQSKFCSAGSENVGCGYTPPESDTSSYGDGFNAVQGGVYAMQWDDKHINLWHFARNDIPSDIITKKPEPSTWGLPQARFGGDSCNVGKYFRNMNLVLNINFCGDYGNAAWGASSCAKYAPTCSEWVANNPKAFSNAYWDVNYIDAYSSADLAPVRELNSAASSPLTPTPIATPMTGSVLGETGASTPSTPGSSMSSAISKPSTPTPATPALLRAGSTADIQLNAAVLSTLPAPTAIALNPGKIGNYANMGCFGSSNQWASFEKAGEDDKMTIDMCVSMCGGIKYAGVYSTTCYCAAHLDSDTRSTARINACNSPCPGNKNEFCGGLLNVTTSKNFGTGGIVAPTGIVASTGMVASTGGTARPTGGVFPAIPLDQARQMSSIRRSTIRRWTSWHAPARRASQAPAVQVLLTVYAQLDDEPAPIPAPEKPPVTREKVTAIPYKTVDAANPTLVIEAYAEVTIKVINHCGCDDDWKEAARIPITTKIIPCHRCGHHGENYITATVPCTDVVEPTEYPSPTNPPPPPPPVVTPPCPTESGPAVVVGGASALTISGTLAAAILAVFAFI